MDDLSAARGIVLSVAVSIVLWSRALHAAPLEACKAPSIARVTVDARASMATNTVKLKPTWLLACPSEGKCEWRMTMDIPAEPVETVVCLTPAENAAAEARW